MFDSAAAAWLAANPDGGEKLLEYYRSFGLEELVVERSKWVGGREEHFFMRSSDPTLAERIRTYVESSGS